MIFDKLPVVVDDPTTILPASAFPNISLFQESAVFPVISVALRATASAKARLKGLIPTKRKCIFDDGPERRKIVLLPNIDMEIVKQRLSANNEATTKPTTNDATAKSNRKKSKHNHDGCIPFTIPDESHMTLLRPYEEQSVETILRKLFPETITEIPSALEQVGTIAHLNLRPELLPYQHWIGKVLIDKNTCVKTVVNKTSHIATVFRTFPMQVIAGNQEPNWSIVTVHEHNCTFRLDYQTVYWNSRLAGEHDRLVQLILKKGDKKVADCMAGIGPFAIPLAKRGITVYANDLNDESIKYLNINRTLNGIDDQFLHVSNMDGRDFVRTIVADHPIDCAILNLPASAPEFLDAFRDVTSMQLYVYAFAPKNDATPAVERCQAALGPRQMQDLDIHTVRDVSPAQNMYCISFRLSDKRLKTSK